MFSVPVASQHHQLSNSKMEKRHNSHYSQMSLNGSYPSIPEMKLMERKKREKIAEIHERTQAPPPERFTIQKVNGPDRNLLGLLGPFDNFPKGDTVIELMGIDQQPQSVKPIVPVNHKRKAEAPSSYMPPPLPNKKVVDAAPVTKHKYGNDPQIQRIIDDLRSLRPAFTAMGKTPIKKAPTTNGVHRSTGSHDSTQNTQSHGLNRKSYPVVDSSDDDYMAPSDVGQSRLADRKASLSAVSSISSSDSSSSSCSGSESSSDEAEPENPARTRSSSPTSSWSLEKIFKQPAAGKDDGNSDASRLATSRADPNFDAPPHSPYNTDLAPPVVTKEPPPSRNSIKEDRSSVSHKESVRPRSRESRSSPKSLSQSSKSAKRSGRKEKEFPSVEVLPTDSDSSDEDTPQLPRPSVKPSRTLGPKKLAGLPKPGSKFPTPTLKSNPTRPLDSSHSKSFESDSFAEATKAPTAVSQTDPHDLMCSVALALVRDVPGNVQHKGKSAEHETPMTQIRTSPPNEDQKKQRAIASIYKSSNKKPRSSETPKSDKEQAKAPVPKTEKMSRKHKRSPSPDTRRTKARVDAEPSTSKSQPAFIVPSSETRSCEGRSPTVRTEEVEVSPAARYNSPHESIVDGDETQLLDRAKELKHMADTETNRFLQIIMYLEAGLYFIITGDSMSNEEARSKNAMYSDTFKFIRHVSSIIMREELMNNTTNAKLAILSLWCQSIICIKQYQLAEAEDAEAYQKLAEYLKDPSLQSALNSFNSAQVNPLANHGAPWDRHLSPTSMASTPSPADSNSSGYSTETKLNGTNTHPVPLEILNIIQKKLVTEKYHTDGWAYWNDACSILERYEVQDFFLEIDKDVGKLHIQTSAKQLHTYVKKALNKLQRMILVRIS